MKDKNLEAIMLHILRKLAQQNDALGDTPKRHKISEHIVEIYKLVKAPPNPGYE